VFHQVHNAYCRPDVPSAILATASGTLSVQFISMCAICWFLGEPGLVLYVKVECQVFFDFMINVSYVKSFLEFSHIDIAW
jgi:hypothetical protein